MLFKTENDCSQCPYYGSYYDSLLGDGDEWCECGICKWGDIPSCHYPMFIRHFLAWKEKIRERWYDRQAQRAYNKELKEAYKLGMSEDEYSEYKYRQYVNDMETLDE